MRLDLAGECIHSMLTVITSTETEKAETEKANTENKNKNKREDRRYKQPKQSKGEGGTVTDLNISNKSGEATSVAFDAVATVLGAVEDLPPNKQTSSMENNVVLVQTSAAANEFKIEDGDREMVSGDCDRPEGSRGTARPQVNVLEVTDIGNRGVCSECLIPLKVVIEGNIGAGKSTVLRALLALGYEVHPEPLEEWAELLKKYHEAPAQNGYAFQSLVLDHYERLQDLFKGGIIERSPSAARVFIQVMRQLGYLTAEQIQDLTRRIDGMWRPDVTFYLEVPPEKVVGRCAGRDQVGDGEVAAGYYKDLDEAYEDNLRQLGFEGWGQLVRVAEGSQKQVVASILQELQQVRRCQSCQQLGLAEHTKKGVGCPENGSPLKEEEVVLLVTDSDDETESTGSSLESGESQVELDGLFAVNSTSREEDQEGPHLVGGEPAEPAEPAEVETAEAAPEVVEPGPGRMTVVASAMTPVAEEESSEAREKENIGHVPSKIRWTQSNQRDFERVTSELPKANQDWWHRQAQENVFCEEVFLCQVVPPSPQCGCPHELVYALKENSGVTWGLAQLLEETAQHRLFTAWGSICWHNKEGSVETTELTHCRMVSYEKGEEPHERAVLWGRPLQLAVFGTASMDEEMPQWQLVVTPRMALPSEAVSVTRRKGRAWFTKVEWPLMERARELGAPVVVREEASSSTNGVIQQGGPGEYRLEEEPKWCEGITRGPSLAEGDRRSVTRKTPTISNPIRDPTQKGAWKLESNAAGQELRILLWNARGIGRQIANEGGEMLKKWLRSNQPDVAVIPEAAIPGRVFTRSKEYPSLVRQVAKETGYVLYWAHCSSGQARNGMAMLVHHSVMVEEVVRTMDLDEGSDWEGRILAIRLAGVWILGVYMPQSKEDYRRLLQDQIAAWMKRQKKPVILATDMNSVLDPLEFGVRALPMTGSGSVPSNYFADDWLNKEAFLTESRRQQTQSWLTRNNLTDLNARGRHTSYWRCGFALQEKDRQINETVGKGLVHQRRNQIATSRIDGVFLNPAALQLFEKYTTEGGYSEGPLTTAAERYREATIQALGSDHLPIMTRLVCNTAGVFQYSQSRDLDLPARILVLVDHQQKKLLGLCLAWEAHRRRLNLLYRWRAQARMVSGETGVIHGIRRCWQRTVRKAMRTLLLRYWHIRRMPMLNGSTSVGWDQAFDKRGLTPYCDMIQELVQDWRQVLSGAEIQHRIDEILEEARRLRFFTTVQCYPRKVIPVFRVMGVPTPLLWPTIPHYNPSKGGTVGPRLQAVYGANAWYRMRLHALLDQWKQQAAGGTTLGMLSWEYGKVLGPRWGANTPEKLVALDLLLQQSRGDGENLGAFSWKRNLPWYVHRGTSRWAETMLYLRTMESVEPPPVECSHGPLEEVERKRWLDGRQQLWYQYRKAAQEVMTITIPEAYYGDIARRQTLLQNLLEKQARKGQLMAYWRTQEEVARPQDVVPMFTVLEEAERISICAGGPRTSSLAQKVDAVQWGLDAFTSKKEVHIPVCSFDDKREKHKLYRDMEAAFRTGASNEQTWFADCRKKKGARSGLTYTSGMIRMGSDGQLGDNISLWCDAQLWDTGSDFNVVSGAVLARLLGPQWRQHVHCTGDEGGARMASGHTCQALGTVVLEMDWTVAPLEHQLTKQDLQQPEASCWSVVRIPVKFVVFADFEIPMILGMPMIASMTAGMEWIDQGPSSVRLYQEPPHADGSCRSEEVLWRLPLAMLRGVTPDALLVCVTDKPQWIRCDQEQVVNTRVIAGAGIATHGHFCQEQGWTTGAHQRTKELPLEYVMEGVQQYAALYQGQRRFVTTTSSQAFRPQQCEQGLQVMVRGISTDSMTGAGGLDPEGARQYDQHPRSPWVLDLEAVGPGLNGAGRRDGVPAGTECVYIPAGTPVAWLEPQVIQTVEVTQLLHELRAKGCTRAALLLPVIDKSLVYTQAEGTPYQWMCQDSQVSSKIHNILQQDGTPLGSEVVTPEIFSKVLVANCGEQFMEQVEALWASMSQRSVACQLWLTRVLSRLIYDVVLLPAPTNRKLLWDMAMGRGQQRKEAQDEALVTRFVQERIKQQLQTEIRAQEIVIWMRDEKRLHWLQGLATAESNESCEFRRLLRLLGEEEEDMEKRERAEVPVSAGSAEVDRLFLLRDQLHPGGGVSVLDTERGDELVCATREIGETDLVAELQAAVEYVGERIQQLESPDLLENTGWTCGINEGLVCQLQQRGRRWEMTEEEREAIASAGKQREQLAERLRTDSAFDNPLESVLENPITIPRYMASEEHIRQEVALNAPLTVNCNEVLDRLTPQWRVRIEQACAKERPRRGGLKMEQAARINRFAGYVATVSLHESEYTIEEREAILDLVLELETFFNCDPNVPPEWTGGEPYAGLRFEQENPPIQHQERRIPPLALPVVLEQIKDWLEAGIVEPSKSPHSSPLLIVAKKPLAPPRDPSTGMAIEGFVAKPRYRCCVDFKGVNARLQAVNMSNAPRLETCLHQVASCGGRTFSERRREVETGVVEPDRKWLATTCDLVQGFHQITLAPECRPYTAFTIPGLHAKEGHLQFVCAPFGLSVMPTYFHEVVGQAIGDLHYGYFRSQSAANMIGDSINVQDGVAESADGGHIPTTAHYIDDTFVSTLDTFQGHIAAVRAVFMRLQAVGFGARVDKVEFAKGKLTMLGWSVEEGRITTDQEKARKLVSGIGGTENRLNNRSDVMSALGSITFYRSVIPNAAGISAPLYQLTRKGAFTSPDDWTPVHSAALRALKEQLVADYFLAVPQEGEEFYLITDASVHSGAAVLAQVQPNGAEHPVGYAGTSFPEPARRWSPSERECFTLLWGAEYFDQWLRFSSKAIFCTDHKPLIGLAKAGAGRSANSKLARWAAKLAQWSQATVSYRAGVAMGSADMLSRLVYPAKEETPDSRESMQVGHEGFEPLENTDHWDGRGKRAFGLPMQRLGMLKPPTGEQWVGAEEAYRRATGTELTGVSEGMHEEGMLEKAANESTSEFRKRKDWFQGGAVSPEVAVKILEHAHRLEIWEQMTAAELGNGKYFVTKWKDTRGLETTSPIEGDGSGGLPESINLLEDKLVIWTELYRVTVGQLIQDATGQTPEIEEQEYVCRLDEAGRMQELNSAKPEEGGQQDRINAVQGWSEGSSILGEDDSDYEEEDNEHDLLQWIDDTGIEDEYGNSRDSNWLLHLDDRGSRNIVSSKAESGCGCRDQCHDNILQMVTEVIHNKGGAPANTRWEYGEVNKGEFAPLLGDWERVRLQAMGITRRKCQEDNINQGEVPAPLARYIHSLCDPSVTTILCQGGPGSGKTFTAVLVGMLMIQANRANKLQHTKPLVSAGGASLGYERGSVADKLQYWTRPTKQAAERVSEVVGTDVASLMERVEAWPIDRTRGMSLPSGDWLIADEMQNTQQSLFSCMMTRAERGAKVVLCGDVHQSDLSEKTIPYMCKFQGAWRDLMAAETLVSCTPQEEVQKGVALEQLEVLRQDFRYVELDNTCQMRNAQHGAMATWLLGIDRTRPEASEKIKKARREAPQVLAVQEGGGGMTGVPLLAYSAYAGLDNMGYGASQGCPELRVVGASESDPVAREVFRRRNRFLPFTDQRAVEAHALKGMYVVLAGAPCVSFSRAGHQWGAHEERGQHYEAQLESYTVAQVPVIVLEQVPECREILPRDCWSQECNSSPQDRVVARLKAAGYHVPLGDDGLPGQLMTAADFGGVIHRIRVITVAVRMDVWETVGAQFRWPIPDPTSARKVREVMDPDPQEAYFAGNGNSVHFEASGHRAEEGRPLIKWRKRGRPVDTMGEWDNPDKVYSIDHPMPSPTAMGNTRWYEHKNQDGEFSRRRLSPKEVARAMGVDPRIIDNVGERQAYRLVGNAVPVELAQEVGKIIQSLFVPEVARLRATKWLQEFEVEQAPMGKNATEEEVFQSSLHRQLMYRIKQAVRGDVRLPGPVCTPQGEQLLEYKGMDTEAVLLCADMEGALLGSRERLNWTPVAETSDARRQQYAEAQEQCHWCARLRRYLIRGQHGEQDAQAQRIRTEKESEGYVMMSGLLYRLTERTDGSGLQLCTPESLRDALTRQCHQSPVAIHPNARQMQVLLSRRHYWPEMSASCAAHTKECVVCQRTGRAPRSSGDQVSLVPVGKPLSVVAIDVVGPLGNRDAVTAGGNRHIVTMIDWFTRFVVMYPVREPTAEAIGDCLLRFTARFGVPLTVLSDGAQYFRERALRHLEKGLGVRRAFISAYRAAGNGLLERFHRTLGRAMKTRVHDSGTVNWDKGLDLLALAYNSMEHGSTGYSPHYLMHGYHPALPFDVTDPVEEEEFLSPTAWVREQQGRLNRAHALAYERMNDGGHARWLRRPKLRGEVYHPGDKVLLHIPAVPRGFVRKCTLQWHGPFEVTTEKEGRCYWVKTRNGTRRIHESRLKKVVGTVASERVEQVKIQQEFEDLLDRGAAAGPGWDQLTYLLAESDLQHDYPLESTREYSPMFTFVIEGGVPYRTTDQQQKESTEPRIDADGEEDNLELQLDGAIDEAFGLKLEQEVMVCSHRKCLKIRGWRMGHCSICPACVGRMGNAVVRGTSPGMEIPGTNVEALVTDWGPADAPGLGEWHRVAQARTGDSNENAVGLLKKEKWTFRKCAQCGEQEVWVPQTEIRQYCNVRQHLEEDEAVPWLRELPRQHRYVRQRQEFMSSETGAGHVVFRAEFSDAQMEEMEPVESGTKDDGIPLQEITEIPRELSVDPTGYTVVAVKGHKMENCQYQVQWAGTAKRSWNNVMGLLAAPSAVADYWRSRTGHQRASQIARQRLMDSETVTADIWKYSEWESRVAHGIGTGSHEAGYILAVQLTQTKHRTHSAFQGQLKGGVLDEKAAFTVWVVPTLLQTRRGSVLVPLLEVSYAALRRMVSAAEWTVVNARLVESYYHLAMDSEVPLFWWHSPEQDEKAGFLRDGVDDSVSLSSVLKAN